jgi:hypothetical protein
MTAPNKLGIALNQIRPNPQDRIRVMDRPVWRPSSMPKFIAVLLAGAALWGLGFYVIFEIL